MYTNNGGTSVYIGLAFRLTLNAQANIWN